MAVDVAAVVGAAQQFHVVAAGERAHVVDLRHARQEELHGAGGQVVLVVAAEGRVVRGVDLVEVEVGRGGTGGGLGFAVGVGMDGVDQVVDVLVGHEALEGAVELVGADVDHADAIVRIEHGDGVVRADLGPVGHGFDVTGEQRVQKQRRQGEIVDAVHLGGDLHLLLVIAVNLDEDFKAALDALLAQTGDELKGLGGHEAAGAGFLGAVAHGVETDVAHVAGGHLIEDGHQVFPALGGISVDVHLLRGEADPYQTGLAAEVVVGERQARARAVDAGQVFFGSAVREDGAHGQEHRVVLGVLAVLQHVLELGGFPAHVVDDGVDHDVVGCGEFGDVIPRAEARVDLGVVDRVEACIRTIERSEERQDMHAVIHAVEAGAQDVGHRAKSAIAETIGVCDELHFVFHGTSLGSWARVQFACASACLLFTYLHTHVCIEPVRYYLERDVNVQSRSEMRVSNRLDAVFYAA